MTVPSITKWEYHRVYDLDNEYLDSLGCQGWELVNILPIAGMLLYIFKRPLP